MGTSAKSQKFQFTTNVPVTMDVRYVDVWPARTSGDKTFDPQVSIKGTVNGETVIAYLPGKTWANLKALEAGGVIGPYSSAIEEPEEKVSVPVVSAHAVLCRRQLAAERFATLVVNGKDAKTPPFAEPATARATAKKIENPIELGGPIPGLDDLPDELPPVDEAYERTLMNAGEKAIDDIVHVYRECFFHAAKISKEHGGTHDVAAMAATLFIEANRRGIRV